MLTVGASVYRFGEQVFLCLEAPDKYCQIAVEHDDGRPIPLNSLGRMHIGAFDLEPGTEASTLRVRIGDGPWQECKARWDAQMTSPAKSLETNEEIKSPSWRLDRRVG